MDLSFLLNGTRTGPVISEMPDPLANEQARIVLEGLRRRDRLGALDEESRVRSNVAADAYNKAIPAVIQSGFDPEVVAKVLQQYPEAAPLVQKAWDEHAKRRDEGRKTDATVYKDKTASLLKQYSQMAGGLADTLKKNPNGVPDAMIANFYGKMAQSGLSEYMPALPFRSWDDKAAVAAHLDQLGNAFYETSDRLRNAETGRHNKTTEFMTADRDAETARAHGANERTAAGHLGVAQANLRLAQDKANREANAPPTKAKHVVDVEMKLADDYRTQSKAFQETARQIGIVNSALKSATTNPGSALSAGTSFMKILDPNSVVRESELGMALNASGWFDRAANVGQMLQNGRVMTKAQAANLEREANQLFAEASAAQRKIDAAFTQRAQQYGADPANILIELGQSQAPAGRPKLGMGAPAAPAGEWGVRRLD